MQRVKVNIAFLTNSDLVSSSLVVWLMHIILTWPFLLHRFYLFFSRPSFFFHQSRSSGSIYQFQNRKIALCLLREWTTRGKLAPSGSATSFVSILSFTNICRYLLTYFHFTTLYAIVMFIITGSIINHLRLFILKCFPLCI